MNLVTSSSANERAEAARTLSVVRHSVLAVWRLTVLDLLTRDPSPMVRSHAGEAIGALYRDWDFKNTERIDQIARKCLGSDGVWIPLRTLRGLLREVHRKVRIDISGLEESISLLARNHVDQMIRETANRILSSLHA